MAQDNQASKKRRLVKSPETFRERAVKASENQDKPSRRGKIRSGVNRATTPVVRPIGKGLSRIFSFRPLRFIGRIVGRILLPRYLRSSFAELRQVKWPKVRASRDLTFAVLAFAVAFGGVVAIVDYGLDKVFRQILLK